MKDAPFGRAGEQTSVPAFMRGGRFLTLLQSYAMGNIRASELQDKYRQLFLHGSEKYGLEDDLGRILHHMFSVLERYTTDRKVIAADPEFFIPEREVREEAVLTLQKLRILNRSPS